MYVCVQRSTFQLVLTTDGKRHVMIFNYGRISHKGTVNYYVNQPTSYLPIGLHADYKLIFCYLEH